jgi:hypothetical protein
MFICIELQCPYFIFPADYPNSALGKKKEKNPTLFYKIHLKYFEGKFSVPFLQMFSLT